MSVEIAANCFGVEIPFSPFLNKNRIARLNAGRYEGQEIRGALHVVKPGDRVLELGAGIGVVGAVVASNCKPQKVMSFEANPNLLTAINTLYSHNKLTDVISVTNQALVSGPNAPESLSFYLGKSYLGSSLIDKGRKRATVEVATKPYDEVLEELNPNVILMDIEGGELAILEHADLSGIRAIVIEFHPEAYGINGMRRCKNILREAGFKRVDDLSTRTVWVAEKS